MYSHEWNANVQADFSFMNSIDFCHLLCGSAIRLLVLFYVPCHSQVIQSPTTSDDANNRHRNSTPFILLMIVGLFFCFAVATCICTCLVEMASPDRVEGWIAMDNMDQEVVQNEQVSQIYI
jgi:hypothetical protein